MARSQMAASLGWMSMKGLRLIPMNTLSCKRSSGRAEFHTCNTPPVLWGTPPRALGSFQTSTVGGLVPQDPLQVGGPGFLRLHAGPSERVRVLPFSPAEPDFKAQSAHA